ncbi:MAG: hypothetical protein V3T05_01535, partial [Myxococcota bacterium]
MTEPSRGRLSRHQPTLWLGLGLTAAFLLALFPLTNTDIWWHLAAGRRIVEQRAFLYQDPFSISAAGRPWVDLHWLFQVVAYVLHAIGGVTALVVSKAMLVAAGVLLLVLAAEQTVGGRVRGVIVACTVAGLVPVRHLILARPIVVTLVLMAAFFFVLERVRAGGDRRLLTLLPLLQIIWANCQGLHPLGPVLVACYVAGVFGARLLGSERIQEAYAPASARMLPWVLVTCIAASWVTPYGYRAWQLPFLLLGRIDPTLASSYAVNVSEMVPPWLLAQRSPLQAAVLPVLALLTLASFVLIRRRLVLSRLLVAAAVLGLAMLANRNLLLAAWMCAPIVAMNVAASIVSAGEKSGGRLTELFRRAVRAPHTALGALALTVALALALMAREPDLREPAPFRLPSGAVELLRSLSGGPVFSSVRLGVMI